MLIRELSVAPKEELVARARDLGAPARARRRSCEGWEASGRAVLRGRRRNAGRRRAHDAARRGRHLRRQRHLQVEGSQRFARAIVDATTHFNEPSVVLEACRSLGRFGGDARTRCPPSGVKPSSWLHVATKSPVQVGVLALQGDVVEHLAALRTRRRRSDRGKERRAISRALTRSSFPAVNRRP